MGSFKVQGKEWQALFYAASEEYATPLFRDFRETLGDPGGIAGHAPQLWFLRIFRPEAGSPSPSAHGTSAGRPAFPTLSINPAHTGTV